MNIGPSATPAELEALVRAVRVAASVGTTATSSSLRRTASERMRFPTDSELYSASERLPSGSESSLAYRAADFARTRTRLQEEFGGLPPDYLWRRGLGRLDAKRLGLLGTNFERMAQGSITRGGSESTSDSMPSTPSSIRRLSETWSPNSHRLRSQFVS